MPALSVMVKPASSLCNMRCKYCFYHDVSSSRETQSYGIMTHETARALIESTFELADGGNVTFLFQGGEPLLAGIEFYRYFLRTVAELKGDGSVSYGIQTNGLCMDKAWVKLFCDNGFLVGLSLDGDFEANAFRTDAQGKNVFHRVIRAAELLERGGVEFNILSVVTGKSADNTVKIYKSLTGRGFRWLQFIPCLRPFGENTQGELYMTVEQYSHFLRELSRLYFDDILSGKCVSVRRLDNWASAFLGKRTEQCGMSGHCSRQFVVEGNGNVYPCDFYCTDEWLLGNVNDISLRDMTFSEAEQRFLDSGTVSNTDCDKCEYNYLCRAQGCRRSREDGDYCEAYKAFFPEFIDGMKKLNALIGGQPHD